MLYGSKPKKSSRKAKVQPNMVEETLADCKAFLDDILRSYTDYVDQIFPNADFLSQQDGSYIQRDSKLSFVLRSRFDNLTQMKLPKTMIKNFRKTVLSFLDKTRTTTFSTHKQLTSVIGGYHSLSNAKQTLKTITAELHRLQGLDLTVKTVDRQMADKLDDMHTDIDVLARNLENVMATNENVHAALRGQVNSLVSFARLLQAQTKAPAATS